MVSFDKIPINLRTPGQFVEFDNSRAVQGLAGPPHRCLLIGQRLAGGTVEALAPVRVLTAEQADASFGRGSQLAQIARAFRSANPYTECWAVALDDDPAGVAARGSVEVTGTATAAGVVALYVGGQRVRAAVGEGASAASVMQDLAQLVNMTQDLPVTAAVVDGGLELTARNAGECGNFIDVRFNLHGESFPEGLSGPVQSSGSSVMAGGSANPDIEQAWPAIGDTHYNTLVVPYTDAANLQSVHEELERRWGPMVQKEGLAFAGATGTHGQLAALLSGLNSPHVVVMGGGRSPTPPWIWAATVAAIDAFEPDLARPRQTLALPGVLPPAEGDRFTLAERNLLLYDGISTYTVDPGGEVLVERLITTYQQHAFGIEDPSYLDVTTMRTLAYLRYTVRARIAMRFPRHKLASDGARFGPGQAVVTPSSIRAELLALFSQWEHAGLVENFEQFKKELVVERNAGDPNRVDAVLPPDLMNQFRVFAARIRFLL